MIHSLYRTTTTNHWENSFWATSTNCAFMIDGCLPFLDIQIIRNYVNIEGSAYWKPTQMGQYLNRSSNYLGTTKRGVIRTLKEVSKIRSDLRKCGCLVELMGEVLKQYRTKREIQKQQEGKLLLRFPCIKGLSDEINRMAGQVVWKLKQFFTLPMPCGPAFQECGPLHKPLLRTASTKSSTCRCGQFYIRETKRSL